MNLELVGALNELEKERGISKEILFEAIEAAIVSAYKRHYGNTLNVRVDLNERTGEVRVFARKDVVDEVLDEPNEISLEDAKAIDPNYDLDDIVEIEVTPKDFGRIAAQTAKQVVIQRIREAERALIYEEFSNREGDIMTGIVQRHEYRSVMVDLGKVEAVMPPSEQVPREQYTPGTRLKVYVTEVRQTTKGPQVYVSRTHPGLLGRLFELEVPEIHDGIVEIKAISREPGNRSKIAVASNDRNVDPVGACVGPRGMRVQSIVQELRGEKIDIIAWDPMPDRFIANALSPAKVVRVVIDPQEKSARAVVPDNQLSLAIGKEGQNARLAARLTGWKIDIKSETQMRELVALEALRPKESPIPPVSVLETQADEPVEIEPVDEEVLAVRGDFAGEDLYADDAGAVSEDLDFDETVEPETDFVLDERADETEEDGAAYDEAGYDEYDPDEETIEDDEDEEDAEPVAPAKPKRKRAPKRDELQDILEEVDSLAEDPLPSLFQEDDEELESVPTPTAPIPVPRIDTKALKRTIKRGDQGREEKRVIKDLSELAKLIRREEEKD